MNIRSAEFFWRKIDEMDQKFISIFEPHTDIILNGEHDIAFGHKTFFQ